MSAYRHGLVVGTFAPLHRGYEALIEAARSACARVTVMVGSTPDVPAMPTPVRAAWIESLDATEAPRNDAPADVHHAFVHARVAAHVVQRVVFLGAESSGKSTLAKAVAERLGEPYAEEYGRTLWEERGGRVPLADYVLIAEQHRAIEDAALLRARRFLFCDTNAVTTQQYAFFFHGDCPERVQHLASEGALRYAHTVVCAPDIPFDQDGTRVHPQVQQYMDGAIRNDLTIRGIPYTVVGGTIEARVAAVCDLLGVPT